MDSIFSRRFSSESPSPTRRRRRTNKFSLLCSKSDFQVVLINCPNLSLTALSRFYFPASPDRRAQCDRSDAFLFTAQEREISHKIDVGNLKPSCLSSFALHSRLAAFIIKKKFRHNNSGPREKNDIGENLKFNACSFSSLKLAELPKNCIKFPSHL